MQLDTLEYALLLCCGHSASFQHVVPDHEEGQIIVLDEAETPDFEDQIRSSPRTAIKATTHIRLALLNSEAGVFAGDLRETYGLFREYWDIDMRDVALLSSQLMSSYHSRAITIDGQMCLEICYNVRESLLYVANGMDPLGSSPSVNRGPRDMVMQHQNEALYFRYNLITGQTTYILFEAKRDIRELLNALGARLAETSRPNLHPLALQTVILFTALSTRGEEIENLLKRLLWIEDQLHQGAIFEITDSKRFSKYIQLLHTMSRSLITVEHSNQRDMSNVNQLLRDHSRLWKLTKRDSGAIQIDLRSHERIRDDLLRLRDFCGDRERRIINLRQRTQDFITLLYHLITGHDSDVNLGIAAQSAHIAREARRDSMSMKIIAAVTMFYLPATFVCSLFGTNLVALNTNAPEPTFVVSKLWWLYIAFAVPLTLATMFGFVVWRKWREGGRGKTTEKLEV